VSHLGTSSDNATAKYYAEATRKRLAESLGRKPSLEYTQASLMLGFHEWTELQGQMGWVKIHTAIGCATALGCQNDAILDAKMNAALKNTDDESVKADMLIDREIQRRTFWSCYIMDRYVSCGSARPEMLSDAKMDAVQLPCSDSAFNHGRKVRTRRLGEDDITYEKRRSRVRCERGQTWDSSADDIEWEYGKDEGELSLYIQAVHHFGHVMKWSCAGGRR